MVHINKKTLNELNSSQATLIKMNLALSKYELSTQLLNALRIESIKHLYLNSRFYLLNKSDEYLSPAPSLISLMSIIKIMHVLNSPLPVK